MAPASIAGYTLLVEKIICFVSKLKKVPWLNHRERKVFGAPVLDNQYVHIRLAELLTEVRNKRRTVKTWFTGGDVEVNTVQGCGQACGWRVSSSCCSRETLY